MMNYALQVAEEVDPHEPSIYKEPVSCSEFAQWLAALEDEIMLLIYSPNWFYMASSNIVWTC